MQMDEGARHRPDPAAARRSPIGAERRPARRSHDELAALGAGLIVEALDGLARGPARRPRRSRRTASPTPPSCASDEARLDWRRPAAELERQMRALNPWPGACFEARGERIRVLAAEPRRQPRRRRAGHGARRSPDDRLRRGRAAAAARAARRPRGAWTPTPSCAASRCRPGPVAAVPRYKLTLEYDGSRFRRLAAPGERRFDPGGAGDRDAPVLRRDRDR